LSAPLFSILMPTHYRADVIEFAIASVLAQDEPDFELLVVGDGAEVGTSEAVAEFDDPRIRWMDFPKGPAFGYANRNKALAEARGRYVAFVADDDLIFPDHLSRLRRHLDAGAVLACTRAAWVSADGIAAPMPTSLDLVDEYDSFTNHSNVLPASCFGYRRSSVEDGEHFPEDAPSEGDWLLWKRLLRDHPDAPLAVDPTSTVFHVTAKRKAARDSGFPELAVLLEVADSCDWWPEILRPNIPPGLGEQKVWATELQPGGRADAVRRALMSIVDRLAWESVQSCRHPSVRRARLSGAAPEKLRLPDGFDRRAYLELNKDVRRARIDPVQHWFEHGRFEGRRFCHEDGNGQSKRRLLSRLFPR
jgi:hypothetical protein